MAAESTTQAGCDAEGMHDEEFDLEFGEIQTALEGLSRDLGEKLSSQPEEHGNGESRKGHKGSLNLEHLLTCDDEEFFAKIESLPLMDLDMAILVFEEHIKAHKKGVTAKQGNDARSFGDFKGLRRARDRLNLCFLEKVRRSQKVAKPCGSPTASDQHQATPEKPKRYIVRASALPEEFECMTKNQLRALLRHHSVKHNSESDKDSLMELLIDQVLQGEGGDWEPPKEEEIKWAEPSEVFQPQTLDELRAGFDETDWHVSVTVTDQKTMVDWDPVPLLKELYLPISQNQTDESWKNKPDSPPKLTGYLEKLPVNQTKPKAFKGWKRRFFKIMRGKIFYYEDHKADSPLGSLPLRGGKITVPGEKMIQITSEISGEILVVRCSSTNESKDWYRVLHEEAVSSLKRRAMNGENGSDQSSIIIIDLGASSIRGGFASDYLPTVAFPAVYAVKHDRGSSNKFTASGLPDPHLCSCGFDALRPQNRKVSKLIYPLKPSLKIDKYSVKVQYLPGFIENVIQSLYLKPLGLVVIISCPQYLGDQDKEYLCDYLFGQLNVKAVYIQQQAILALYSYSDTSGIIVDIGDHVDVIPVVEGTVIDHGRTSFPFGGQQITESLSKLLPQSGHRFFSEVESYIVRYVKEKCAFVYEESISDKNVIIPKAVVDVKKFALPNGEKVIEVDAAQVKCTEGLFEPSLWGKDHPGLHHAVAKAIKACGIDERREMCRKIYLTGGTTLLRGLPERLQKELKRLLPDGVTIQVQAGENRLNAAFKGAALLSKLPTFSDALIKQEEWTAYGAELLSRWHQK